MNRSEQSMLGRLSRCGLAAALVASAWLTGCTTRRPIALEPTPSFVFRSLDLSQRADDGNRGWDLTSPEARYDLSSRTIRARRPEGVLYRMINRTTGSPPISPRCCGMESSLFLKDRCSCGS